MAEDTLWALSGVNKRLEPFVQLRKGDTESIAQMTPAEARNYASQILEAADAAESDGFVVTFLTKKVGVGIDIAAQILFDFRQYRESFGGQRMPKKEDFQGGEYQQKGKDDVG